MPCPFYFLHLLQPPSRPLIIFFLMWSWIFTSTSGLSHRALFLICPPSGQIQFDKSFMQLASTVHLNRRWGEFCIWLATIDWKAVRSHSRGGSLEFKGKWDLGPVGWSDEVNWSAETDSRQNQVSVQIPACLNTSTQECLETSKTSRNCKSCWCAVISPFPCLISFFSHPQTSTHTHLCEDPWLAWWQNSDLIWQL